jgi:hypothetical protein
VLRNTEEGNVQKLGKVSSRKLLSCLCCPIGTFIANYYLPALEWYAYHLPHVRILGKKNRGKLHQEQFDETWGMVKTKRDYAERLLANLIWKYNPIIMDGHSQLREARLNSFHSMKSNTMMP